VLFLFFLTVLCLYVLMCDLSSFACVKSYLSLKEQLAPRTNLAPLLLRLEERRPEHLDYIGVSYGLTSDLLK